MNTQIGLNGIKQTPQNFFPLDGASGDVSAFIEDVDGLKEITSNQLLPLEQRLEAFEDMIDSEVGDTDLARAKKLEKQFGLRQIYLKFEGGNPSGTQKDRIAFAQVMDALRRGFDTITMATCGNYGVAVALAASTVKIRTVIYIPQSFESKRVREMESFKAEILRVPGDYENAVAVSQERAEKDDFYDANPGGRNLILQLKAYGEIAFEIYDQLRDAPAAVAVPVSNGTTLAGIYRGFASLYRRGKTSRMPRFVAGSSYRKNPIIQSFLKNHDKCQDLKPEDIKETAVNEPLINWHSIDGDEALTAIKVTNGWADYISDKKMREYTKLLKDTEGFLTLPAATAGLAALVNRHSQEPIPNDRYVAILTGKQS